MRVQPSQGLVRAGRVTAVVGAQEGGLGLGELSTLLEQDPEVGRAGRVTRWRARAPISGRFGPASYAAEVLGGVGALPEAAITRLVEIIAGENPGAAISAAEVLGGVGALPEAAITRLGEIIAGENRGRLSYVEREPGWTVRQITSAERGFGRKTLLRHTG